MAIEISRARMPMDLFPSQAAVDLIKAFEGLSLKAYQCSAGKWTIGYGSTGGVTEGMTITLSEAERRLADDVEIHAHIVRNSVRCPLTQHQFDALTSYAFNIGKIMPSLLAALNGGVTDKGVTLNPQSYEEATRQIVRACRSGGKPLAGLYRRRLAEACMFNGLPWENACSQTLIRFRAHGDGSIDFVNTTTLEETLERARRDMTPVKKIPPVYEWPVKWNVPAEPLAVLPDEIRKPEPDIDPPPEELTPDPEPEQPEPIEAPAVPDPAPVIPAPPPAPAPKPTPPPPVIAKPVPPPPPERKMQEPKIDTRPFQPASSVQSQFQWSGAKDMFLSKRFYGGALIIFGRLVMANSVVATAIPWMGVIAGDALILDFTSGFLAMVAGEALRAYGEKKAKAPLATSKEIALHTPPPGASS